MGYHFLLILLMTCWELSIRLWSGILLLASPIKISELQRLEELSTAMMEMMLQVFPNRDGTARGWKLGKFHAVVHTVLTIVMFGWTENTSGQWGERAHVDLMKSMARLTNNKDIFQQFLSWHERSSHIQRLFQAQFHEVVDRKERVSISPCELAIGYPLLLAAVRFKETVQKNSSDGQRSLGRYQIDIWRLPANRQHQPWYVREHPLLSELPTALGVFAYDFLPRTLELARFDGDPSVAQANQVLLDSLVTSNHGTQLRTFACLEIKLPGVQGQQRIRSYPFGKRDEFNGKNIRPSVFVIPPERFCGCAFKDFVLDGHKDADKLWVGFVEHMFQCSFTRPDHSVVPCDVALVRFLYPFEVPSALGPLQRKAGAMMFYDPSPKPWLRVVPVRNIIGRAPIHRCYLKGGTSGTIPRCFASAKDRYFEHGRADGDDGVGSQLYELNTYAWRFGRPMPE